jgi:hypothetical protein
MEVKLGGGGCSCRGGRVAWLVLLLVVSFGGRLCAADDIVHDDSLSPSPPGCTNSFVLVRFRSS